MREAQLPTYRTAARVLEGQTGAGAKLAGWTAMRTLLIAPPLMLIGIDARRAWAGATLSSILISTLTLLRLGTTVALKKPEKEAEASEATTIEGAGRPRRVRRAAPKRRAK
jgi:hypothetical protein